MATLISGATGNASAAATWRLVDATSLLQSNGSTTALTASDQNSANFVPAAVAIDAVAVKLASRATGSPSNTITITLRNVTGGTDVVSLTINVSDLPACSTTEGEGGWHVFKFGSTHTPNGTDSYCVRARLSATTTAVSLYRDNTGANWARMLRTTTTQAPAAGDNLMVEGEHTGAGTTNTFTVTWDITATTDFGTASTSLHVDAVGVSQGGTLKFGTTAATNYYMKLSGNLQVYHSGTFTIGDATTQIPRDSTAILEFDCASNLDFLLAKREGGNVSMRGLSRTSGKDIIACKLNTDEAAGQTTLGVDTDTGWLNGDEIGIAPTTITATQVEVRTLNANATSTELSISSGLTNARTGTSPMQAEIVLLTRNVIVRGISSAYTNVAFAGSGTCDLQWVLFRYMGTTSGSGLKTASVYIASTVAFTVRYCVVRDAADEGFYVEAIAHASWTIDSCIVYNQTSARAGFTILQSTITTGGWTLTNNYVMGCPTGISGYGFNLQDMRGTVASLTVSGSSIAQAIVLRLDASNSDLYLTDWTINGVVIHSNGLTSAILSQTEERVCASNGVIQNFYIWHNTFGDAGITSKGSPGAWLNARFETGRIFGNSASNAIGIELNSAHMINCKFKDVHCSGDTTYGQDYGFYVNPNGGPCFITLLFENCTFGVASGIYTTHSQGDFGFATGSGKIFMQAVFVNCSLSSGTPVENFTRAAYVMPGSYLAHQRWQQGSTHRVYLPEGVIYYETGTVDVSPGTKMVPQLTTYKLKSNAGIRGRGFVVRIASGATKTITVKVQKDGSYNGNAPRLMQASNPAIGVNSDTVLDTHSIGSGSFETLSGTTAAATADGVAEFYVDCDGTAGAVFVDTWTLS